MIAQTLQVQNKWAKSPYCKLLLRMNGINDGTTFYDESFSPKTITVNGNTCTKTATKRLGTSSAYFDGTGDTLTIPDSDDWYFGTGALTFSMWINLNTLSGYQGFIQQATDVSNLWTIFKNSDAIFFYKPNGDTTGSIYFSVTNANFQPIVGKWFHLVITRDSATWHVYIDGLERTITWNTANNTSAALPNLSSVVTIGYDLNNTGYLNGYIDELVIWKGVAVPITDLYPPRAPLYDYAISEWGGQ